VHTLSFTLDNAREFAGHETDRLEKRAVAFTLPTLYASWQRGTIENPNGLCASYSPREPIQRLNR